MNSHTVKELLQQVKDNQQRERYMNYTDCKFWARQWKFLAIELSRKLEKKLADEERRYGQIVDPDA